jgi:hypothetical protein
MKISVMVDDAVREQLVRAGFLSREEKDNIAAVQDLLTWFLIANRNNLATAMEFQRFSNARRDQFRAERKNDNFNGGDGGVTFRI